MNPEDIQEAQENEAVDAVRRIVHLTIWESYKDLFKKLKRLKKNRGIEINIEALWMEVGMAMVDELMASFPLPDGSKAFTSTHKGHLIPAEWLAYGAMWSIFCAGTRIDEFVEELNKFIEKNGVNGRNGFIEWWRQMELQRGGK